jgi:hypothetical protein
MRHPTTSKTHSFFIFSTFPTYGTTPTLFNAIGTKTVVVDAVD